MSKKPLIASINVVPYIDVMLVMLVIFMVTAPMIQTGVDVDLPHSKTRSIGVLEVEPLILSVDEQGHFFLNVGADQDKPLAVARVIALSTAALQLDPSRRVLVKGDRAARYQAVFDGIPLLQKAGIQNVSLMAAEL